MLGGAELALSGLTEGQPGCYDAIHQAIILFAGPSTHAGMGAIAQ